jgi:hypothetical protein
MSKNIHSAPIVNASPSPSPLSIIAASQAVADAEMMENLVERVVNKLKPIITKTILEAVQPLGEDLLQVLSTVGEFFF